MTTKGYTVLGWLSGRSAPASRSAKIDQNKLQLGAAGVVAAVVVGGAIAAKAAGGDGED